MRFHHAESAFFVFISMILAAGVVTLYAHGMLHDASMSPSGGSGLEHVSQLLFVIGILLATALFFGVFFIYPLIRLQVREGGKLRAMTETLSARSVTLEQAAVTDGLTGMHNRRFFDQALQEYITEFQRVGRPIGLMVMDLDHFKSINDTHGHDAGDKVLKAVATSLGDLTRYHDVVARLGGEEFAIIVPNMNEAAIIAFAERIRKAISAVTILAGNSRIRVTASLGLAVWSGDESAEEFFRRADQRLYQAKGMGRNRVCA